MNQKGWIGIGILILVIAGVGVFFYGNKKGEEKKENSEVIVESEVNTEKEPTSEEKEEKKEKKAEKAEEKREKKEDKKEEQIVTNPLEGAERSGNYWMMMNFKVTDKGEEYEIVGDVYDAKKYSEWADSVGSAEVPDDKNVEEESGLVKKQVLFILDRTTKVENDGMEGFEYPEQELKDFLSNPYKTFLFDNKNDLMIRILDWYMNYAG